MYVYVLNAHVVCVCVVHVMCVSVYMRSTMLCVCICSVFAALGLLCYPFRPSSLHRWVMKEGTGRDQER